MDSKYRNLLVIMSIVVVMSYFGWNYLVSDLANSVKVDSLDKQEEISSTRRQRAQRLTLDERTGFGVSTLSDSSPENREAIRLSSAKDALARFSGQLSENPFTTYQKNLEAAMNGDADAQYNIYSVFSQCETALRSKDIDEFATTDSFPDDVIEDMRKLQKTCDEMHAEIGTEEIKNGRKAWFESAAEQRQPLALIQASIREGFDPSINKSEIFESAFETNHPDIYRLVMFYHSVHNTDAPLEGRAWNLITCSQNPRCDVNNAVDSLMALGHLHETTQVLDRVIEIDAALQTKSWDKVVPDF